MLRLVHLSLHEKAEKDFTGARRNRLVGMEEMDEILVMDAGHVVERGAPRATARG